MGNIMGRYTFISILPSTNLWGLLVASRLIICYNYLQEHSSN